MNRSISKMQYKINDISKFIIFVCAFLVATIAIPKNLLANDFIQTFAIRHGGSAITAEEVPILAKYDMFNCNRFQHDDVNGDTWPAIKAINPDTKIFLYMASRPDDNKDHVSSIKLLRALSRWNVSRGHSMSSLHGDNPNLLLLDSKGNLIFTPPYPFSKIGDIGSVRFQNYWLEATIHDLVNRPWTADGVFIDVVPFRPVQMNAMPVKYNSIQWAEAQHKFINKIVVELGKKNQKVICNTRMLKQSDFDNYVILDNSYAPPYALFNEGSFAVKWGSGDVQFYTESHWKLEVDLMSQIHNFKVAYISHADFDEGQSGTDNWGNPVTFRDILWYAMASYHLGKNTIDNNCYWGFSESYSKVKWYDEFDYIDLGPALGKYKVTNYGGKNIYWREFERGYVYVNPTKYSVSAISLPKKCKQLTRDNFKKDPATIASINTINLKGHRAAFLLKETYDNDKPIPPAPPTNLRVSP